MNSDKNMINFLSSLFWNWFLQQKFYSNYKFCKKLDIFKNTSNILRFNSTTYQCSNDRCILQFIFLLQVLWISKYVFKILHNNLYLIDAQVFFKKNFNLLVWLFQILTSHFYDMENNALLCFELFNQGNYKIKTRRLFNISLKICNFLLN